MRRYLANAATQLAITAASISFVPPLVGCSTESVYLATAALLTTANFLLFRNIIFHPEPTDSRVALETIR